MYKQVKKFNLKKIVLIGFLSMVLLSGFLTPATKAQVWTYTGADTQPLPNFSLFPSEWYVYDFDYFPGIYAVNEISHSNISDYGGGNGYCVWSNGYTKNITSGELVFSTTSSLASWNDSIGWQGTGLFIPVENDGKVSQRILDNVSAYLFNYLGLWEFNQTYLSSYSIALWNEVANNYFMYLNFTEDGIMTKSTIDLGAIPSGISTLVSWPARLPPEFSFTTESGVLDVNSADIKLNASITDADNNNNGVIDTDYLYRILIGSAWTNWTTIPTLIDYDLSSIPSGAHQITIEVKNMYGITQEQITIQYTAPTTPEGIHGYSTILITIVLLLGISTILFKYRRMSKY